MSVSSGNFDYGPAHVVGTSYTVSEVAARLAVGTAAAYELVRSGRLPAFRLGRRIRVDADALEDWIARGGCADPVGGPSVGVTRAAKNHVDSGIDELEDAVFRVRRQWV